MSLLEHERKHDVHASAVRRNHRAGANVVRVKTCLLHHRGVQRSKEDESHILAGEQFSSSFAGGADSVVERVEEASLETKDRRDTLEKSPSSRRRRSGCLRHTCRLSSDIFDGDPEGERESEIR